MGQCPPIQSHRPPPQAAGVGQHHDPGNQAMRDSVQSSISSAYGISAAYLNMNATAPGLREAKRLVFLDKTLPLAGLMAEELSVKLTHVAIQWDDLASQSVDVHLRARAIEPLPTSLPDA